MGTILKRLEQIFINSAGLTRIEFQFGLPPVKFIFEKTEFLEMARSPQIASRTLAKCFVERRVFWVDFHHERFDFILKSLVDVEPLLEAAESELTGTRDLAAMGWGRFIGAWRSRVVETRKQVEDELRKIDEEKAADPYYDSAWKDRDAALQKALVDLRVRVYPLIDTLIAVLDEDDPMKEMAEERLEQGMTLLSPRQIRAIEPEITAV